MRSSGRNPPVNTTVQTAGRGELTGGCWSRGGPYMQCLPSCTCLLRSFFSLCDCHTCVCVRVYVCVCVCHVCILACVFVFVCILCVCFMFAVLPVCV